MNRSETILIETFRSRAQKYGSRTALRRKKAGKWEDISWEQFNRWVMSFAAALIGMGLRRGEAVTILSQNRVEWAVADLGIIAAGGRTAAIYASNTPDDVAYIVNHSEARFIAVENAEQLNKVLTVLPKMPALEKIIVFDPPEDAKHEKIISFQETCTIGENSTDEIRSELEERINAAEPDDVITIIYTSGTTGPPKGAMLTNSNVLFICRTIHSMNLVSDKDSTISYLPLAHALERMEFYHCIYACLTVCFAESFHTLAENIREVKPTMIVGVPRVFEKIYDRIHSTVDSQPAWKRAMFQRAVAVGKRARYFKNRSLPLPILLRVSFFFYDVLVYKKLKKLTGGRLRFLVSGGAPLSSDIAEFFHAVDMPIYEAYGLTETSAPATYSRPGAVRFGCVGKPLPGVEIKIAADGEILVRGGNVFKGYFKDLDATSNALIDGWFHTGDIGEITPEGYLKITDRKKDLIITSGGKNIAPQNIENLLKTSKYISQAVIIGDRRPFLTALITLNHEEIEAYAKEHGIDEIKDHPLEFHPEIHKLIESVIAEKNEHLARYEAIKKFKILPRDFTQEAGEITPTLKVKRRVINLRYADLIEELYQ